MNRECAVEADSVSLACVPEGTYSVVLTVHWLAAIHSELESHDMVEMGGTGGGMGEGGGGDGCGGGTGGDGGGRGGAGGGCEGW